MSILAAITLAASLVTGHSGYYYATAFDSGNATGHAGESISAQFLTEPQVIPDYSDHSITEIYAQDSVGNAVEIGIIDDGANSGPTLFVTSWSRGKFDGFSAGFVSVSTLKPGQVIPPLGAWAKYGINYASKRMTFTYNNHEIGYIPSSYWSGGYGGNAEAQVYGEAFNYIEGGTLPTMNGGVRNFSAGGNTLTRPDVSTPYQVSSITPTSFLFSGPH